MKRRFSEEQIISILKQQEGGIATSELCRQHNISSATFYKWKAKFGGMNASEAQKLRQLESENANNANPVMRADYGSQMGIVSIAPGQTTATVSIPIFGDTLTEGNEAFFVRIVGPVSDGVAVSDER